MDCQVCLQRTVDSGEGIGSDVLHQNQSNSSVASSYIAESHMRWGSVECVCARADPLGELFRCEGLRWGQVSRVEACYS